VTDDGAGERGVFYSGFRADGEHVTKVEEDDFGVTASCSCGWAYCVLAGHPAMSSRGSKRAARGRALLLGYMHRSTGK